MAPFIVALAVLVVCPLALAGASGSESISGSDDGLTEFELVWTDEFVYSQFGSEVGRARLEMYRSAGGAAQLVDTVRYASLATDVVTRWELDETASPITLERYSFSVSTPSGQLDVSISWGDEVTYEIAQTGGKAAFEPRLADPAKSIGPGPRLLVVPLDNNALPDYVVATWLLPSDEPGEHGEFGLVLPVSLPQHAMVLDTGIEYLGLDNSLGKEALKYRVSVGGTAMLIWTTPDERRLLKLGIAAQGVEIANESLLEQWSEGKDSPEDIVESGVSSKTDEAALAAFVEQDVQVPARGGSLAATLSYPADAAGEVPGVVIVAGSGPTDRDGNNPLIPGHVNTYKEIAHYLASRGVAVLRYDKRGIGGSAGLALAETPPFSWYADDVQSCVEFLASVNGVDENGVFVAGHSEGGVLALMAASAGSELAGLVLLSAPGYPLDYTLKLQIGAQADALESMGLAGIKEKMLTALDDLYDAIRTGEPFDYTAYGLPNDYASIYLSLDAQREFAEGFLFVDPAELARQVDVPVCIIQGTADTQVYVDNALNLVSAIGEEEAEVYIVEGVDHVLKPTEGEPLPYGDPSRRVSPEVLEAIESFLTR